MKHYIDLKHSAYIWNFCCNDGVRDTSTIGQALACFMAEGFYAKFNSICLSYLITLKYERHIFAAIQVCTIHFRENHFLKQQSFNERYKKNFQEKTFSIQLSLSLSKFCNNSHRIGNKLLFNQSWIFLYRFHHIKFFSLYLSSRTHPWINRMEIDVYISRRGYDTC